MKVTKALGTLVAVPAIILAAGSCSERTPDRTPTGLAAAGVGLADERSFENDGSGSNFKVFGDADLTRDPENPANVVLKVVNDGGTPAGAYRKLHNVQLWQLDHQLSFKYAFVAPHTCGGGSPRVILIIDANGDGKFEQATVVPGGVDFALNGHVNPPVFGACPTSTETASGGGASPSTLLWHFEDLTDELTRWEITPGSVVPPGFPGYPGPSWDAVEQVVSLAYPNHRVLEAIFLEDFNPTPGTAYYDLITVHDLTLGTRGQVAPERGNRND